MNEQVSEKPWHKHPMVWLVIGIPLSSVIVGIYFAFMAISNPNDVVKDNYYKDGLAINQLFAEDSQARDLGLEAQLNLDQASLTMTLALNRTNQPFVRLALFHSNDRDLDISAAMVKTADVADGANYSYQFKTLPIGRWYVQIKGDDGVGKKVWRLRSRVDFPLSGMLTLTPSSELAE